MSARVSWRNVLGSLRILGRRAVEVGQPGLANWAMAGEVAAGSVASAVRDTAYRAETRALTLAEEIEAMTADGIITADELGRLQLSLAPSARRIAGDCHDVGEIVS